MKYEGTVLLPIAGRSSRFPGTRPKWMLTTPTGRMLLEEALSTIADWRRRRVVIGALKPHLEELGGEKAIRLALGDSPEIVLFPDVTSGPAETVARMIEAAGVEGPIFIKDCDSWFQVDSNVFDNVICIADLRNNSHVTNIPGKSFVKMDEQTLVTGILEKIVCSNYISVGGYGFDDSARFLESFKEISRFRFQTEPFISHIITESMKQGRTFKTAMVRNYVDVGTLEAWHAFREKFTVYVIDLDGVVIKNAGQYSEPLWSDADTPIIENVEALRHLQKEGAQFVFMTARPKKFAEKTEQFLLEHKLEWLSIVYGVNHARRVLINDFAPSNPFPSAVAVNLPRNSPTLESLLFPALSSANKTSTP